jgi:hypothetical protein
MKSISHRIGTPVCLVLVAAMAHAATDWKDLFNGKDLTGWSTGTAAWKVENGVIVGGQGGGRGSLVSKDLYKDFELEFDFMLAEQPSAADGSCATCTYNSGVSLRTGYQVNIGRREAGEFIGVVVHRVHPKAIRGNVLWLDTGDEKFPTLRKKEDWNHLQIAFKGPHLQVTLNGTRICDVTDNPTGPSEVSWKEAGPISFQWPPAGEAGGFAGFVKFRNVRIREL